MTPPVLSMTEWATRLGRNRRWLEQATVQAITRYRDDLARFKADTPELVPVVEPQLAQALRARLDYVVWLTDNSEIEPAEASSDGRPLAG